MTMTTQRRHRPRHRAAHLALALLLGVSTLASIVPAVAAPASPQSHSAVGARVRTATLPPSTACTSSAGTTTCELWAKTGTITLPGAVTVPIWGYSDSALGPAQLPGPTLIANQGDTVNVTLHNQLGDVSALAFPGQALAPDTTGTAGDTTYTFTASTPGTTIYEAGPTPNGPRQVAMGLYGALIVRPTTDPSTSAYGDAASAFDDEALVVLSEIAPALNTSADPNTFDMRQATPMYRLINGKAFPDTDPIDAATGDRVLLRYVNAGLLDHSMGVLGLHQTILATDGQERTYPYQVVAETIAAGQSLDALVTIPGSLTLETKFPLYEASVHLNNGGTLGFGGILTFLNVAGSGQGPSGPTTTNVAVSPNPSDATSDATLTATITSSDDVVDAAEYFIDTQGADGSGQAMSGSFPGSPVNVSATIPAATLAGLSSGSHTIYVHGHDVHGWGQSVPVVLSIETGGPVTSGLGLAPNPTNGTADVALTGTGNESTTGGSAVTAAEYFIDATGANGSGTPMSGAFGSVVVALSATVSAATVNGLAEGAHTISVHGKDAFGNWGAFATITLNVDKTGPTASAVSAAPNPNNGKMSYDPNLQEVRVFATLTDPTSGGINSTLTRAEGFLDAVAANGTGFVFIANDGLFDEATEPSYVSIPLSGINALSSGPHTIYVHGRDAAGNWGPPGTTVLLVDKVGPTVSSVAFSPNPAPSSGPVTLTATASDALTNVAAAEWFEGTDPGKGLGNPMTATDGTFDSTSEGIRATLNVTVFWLAGNHTIKVRAKDVAGNWGPVVTATLTINPAPIFSNGFEPATGTTPPWGWSAVSPNPPGTRIGVTAAAAMAGSTMGLQTVINGNTPSYVQNNAPTNEISYHARFYFNPNGTNTGATGNGGHTIFLGLDGSNVVLFRVQYRRNGSTYQVRAGVLTGSTTTFTAWITITNAPHAIEISWQATNSARFMLYVDGTLKSTLINLNTNTFRLETVRLGATALTAAMSGTERFDQFVSSRNQYIGP